MTVSKTMREAVKRITNEMFQWTCFKSGRQPVSAQQVQKWAKAIETALASEEAPTKPLRHPDRWKIGMRIRYVRDMEYGPSKGTTGRVIRLHDDHMDRPGAEYQVFWTRPDEDREGTTLFWTTPDDVELIEDQNALR